jgi:hypothetical protein
MRLVLCFASALVLRVTPVRDALLFAGGFLALAAFDVFAFPPRLGAVDFAVSLPVRVLRVVRRGRFFTGTTTGGTDGSPEGMISVSPALTGFGVIASATA